MAHPDNTVLDGVWRKTLVLGAIFPGFVVQLQPNWLWCLQITPLGTREVRVEWRIAVAPEVLAAQADPDEYIAGVVDLVHRVNAEDEPVVRGLRSSMDGPQFERAPLSYLERNVYDFDRYVSSLLCAARPRRG
jgi:Ring hydroxylating alpha subunit (catalytic domain)